MEEENRIISKESIKLSHNTKGYTWEIKVQGDRIEEEMARLSAIDQKMMQTYGTPGGSI